MSSPAVQIARRQSEAANRALDRDRSLRRTLDYVASPAVAPAPFEVRRSAPDAVRVHAGPAVWLRSPDDETALRGMQIFPLAVDSGTSADPRDYKTLSVSATCHVAVRLDDPDDPAAHTAYIISGSDYPDEDVSYPRQIVAKIVVESGTIVRIIQYHTGPWIYAVPEIMDGISLARNADGNHSLRAFDAILDNLVSINLDNSVYFPVTTATTGEDHKIQYSNLNDMVQEIIDIIEGYIEEEVVIVSSWGGLNDTSGTPGHILTHGYIPVSDNDTGSLDLKEPSEAGLPFWIQESDHEDCYGSSIGNSAQELVIDLDNETLEKSFTAKIDFTVENDLTVENELFADVIKDLDADMLTINLGTAEIIGNAIQLEMNDGEFVIQGDDDFFKITSTYAPEGASLGVSGSILSWDVAANTFNMEYLSSWRIGLGIEDPEQPFDVIETVNNLVIESNQSLGLRGTRSLDLQYGADGVRFGPEDEDPLTFPEARAMEVVLQASPTSPPQRVRILGAVLGAV